MWSDGNAVTANDWVTTFRYGADPAHAWDFTWYLPGDYQGLGRRHRREDPAGGAWRRQGENEHELIMETQVPAPFLPAMLLYSCPLSAAALRSTGRSITPSRRPR